MVGAEVALEGVFTLAGLEFPSERTKTKVRKPAEAAKISGGTPEAVSRPTAAS
jgi:hypothetical protein